MLRGRTTYEHSDIPSDRNDHLPRCNGDDRPPRLQPNQEPRRLHARWTRAWTRRRRPLRRRRRHVGMAPHGPSRRTLRDWPPRKLDRHRPHHRRLAQLEVHRTKTARLLANRERLHHDPLLPRRTPARHLEKRSHHRGHRHHDLLHLLCLLGHGRRRSLLRILLRHELPPRNGDRRSRHRLVHARRRLPRRLLDRRRPRPHHAHRPRRSADRGHHPRRRLWRTHRAGQHRRPHNPVLHPRQWCALMGSDPRNRLRPRLGTGLLRPTPHHRPLHGPAQRRGSEAGTQNRHRLDGSLHPRRGPHRPRRRRRLPA